MIFDAFISYSHAADRAFASKLQSALRRIGVPWYAKAQIDVFRDDTNLALVPELWPSIENHLRVSKYFVLLASPHAAQSKWVRREVTLWCQEKECSRLLIVLTAGEIAWNEAANDFDWQKTTALPPNLSGKFGSEPKHADLRWARGRRFISLWNRRFREAVSDMASTILNEAKDVLARREQRQRRWTVALTMMAVAALVAAFGSTNHYFNQWLEQRDVARSRELAAHSRANLHSRHDLSLLLAVEAWRTKPTAEARESIWQSLQHRPLLRMYLQHAGRPASVALLEGGRTLAVGGAGDDIGLYESATGKALDPMKGHRFAVWSLATDATGNLLASGGQDGKILVWDVGARRVKWSVVEQETPIAAVALSGDGRLLAAIVDGKPRVWALQETGVEPRLGIVLSSQRARAVAFDPGGQTLATGDENGEIRLWRAATGEITTVLAEKGERIESLAFSPDGRTVAAGTWGGGARYLDVASGRLVHEIGRGIASSVAFSPAGNASAVRRWDGVTLLDARGKIIADLKALAGFGAGGLAFAHDGKTLFTGSGTGSVMVWDVSDGQMPDVWPLAGEPHLLPGDSPVDGIAFDPEARTITTGTYDGGVRTWDLSRKSDIRKSAPRETAGDGYDTIAYSADSRIVVRGSGHGKIAVWETSGPRLLFEQRITKEDSPVTAVALSSDGKILATGDCAVWGTLCRKGQIRVWDLSYVSGTDGLRLQPRDLVEQVEGNVLALAFGAGDRMLFAGTSYGVATIYLAPRKPSTISQFSPDPVSGLAISRDQRWLAALRDRGVLLSEFVDGTAKPQHSLEGHGAQVSTASFSRDGSLLASGDKDGTIILWDVNDGLKLGELRVRSKTIVRSLEFSADGRILAAGGWDGSLTLWARDADEGVGRACRIANRSDVPLEWRIRLGKNAFDGPTCRSRG